jgi:hypothetical protein
MKQKKQEKPRLLARTLAKELTPEDLKVVRGAEPPVSTLVATLPSYKEDQ